MANLFRRVADKLFPSRQAPARTTTQAAQVRDRQYGGSTKDMARDLGVTERTIQRWIKGDRKPRGKDAEKLETAAAKVQTTERGRERRARQVEQMPTGAVRMRVNRMHSFQVRGSSAIRGRAVMVNLTPDQAAALVRADSDAAIEGIAEQAVLDYFNQGGTGYFGRGDVSFDASDIEIV
jgi:DNA-binding transcriptional regulator YiaG